MAENILEVKHLKKYFKTARGTLHAVDDVSFTIEKGKTTGNCWRVRMWKIDDWTCDFKTFGTN